MKSRGIFFALPVFFLLAGCGPGQLFGPTLTPSRTLTPTSTPTPTIDPAIGIVEGKVYWESSKKGIRNFEISLSMGPHGFSQKSDESGWYSFKRLTPGTYDVSFSWAYGKVSLPCSNFSIDLPFQGYFLTVVGTNSQGPVYIGAGGTIKVEGGKKITADIVFSC